MAETHDVYPNAPLALVAVEVRFPSAPGARSLPIAAQRSFRDLLGETWVIESQKAQTLEVEFGRSGQTQQHLQERVVPRFTVRDRTLAVAVTEESLTVETTDYRHYPDFRAVLKRTLLAAADILQPDGVARVGMRYIDELRVPDVTADDPSGWREWLDHSLLPPRMSAMTDKGFTPTAWEGASQYVTGVGRKLVLRYGARDGYAVAPAGPLRRPAAPPPGPFFLLDFDCFWAPTDIPEFDPNMLIETCDGLRAPVRALFDLLVSDRLRDEVFMKEASSG